MKYRASRAANTALDALYGAYVSIWAMPAGSRTLSCLAVEGDHRDRARGLLLILTKPRHQLYLAGVEAVTLGAGHNLGVRLEGVGADLDCDGGIGDHVVIPVGVGGRSSLGGDDVDGAAVLKVDQR